MLILLFIKKKKCSVVKKFKAKDEVKHDPIQTVW